MNPLIDFEELTSAVRSGRITFKKIVEIAFTLHPVIISDIISANSKPVDERAVRRRIYKNVLQQKCKEDPEIENTDEHMKDLMEQWDLENPKPKRIPPAPRIGPLSEEEKDRRATERKLKKEWLEQKRLELGGKAATLGEMEQAEKEYDKQRRLDKKALGTSLDGSDSDDDKPAVKRPVVKRPVVKRVETSDDMFD